MCFGLPKRGLIISAAFSLLREEVFLGCLSRSAENKETYLKDNIH